MAKSPIMLDKELYQRLLTAERELHDVLEELDKADQLGMDTSAWREERQRAMDTIAALKQNYAPTGR